MKILATVDGSAISTEVLPFVADLARSAQATVLLLTVARPSEGYYLPGSQTVVGSFVGGVSNVPTTAVQGRDVKPIETADQASARIESEASDYLSSLAAPLRAGGLTVETRVLISDEISGSILKVAEAEKADIIAMATHGRSGLRAIAQGSVASDVVKAGRFPVLLVRPGTKKG